MTGAPSPRQPRMPNNDHAQAQTTSESRPARVRTAKACRLCNEKRVKCDASERGTPCTRCEQRGESNCQLIQSRRGIYVRKPRKQRARDQNAAIASSEPDVNGTSDCTREGITSQDTSTQLSTFLHGVKTTRPSTAPASVLPQHDTPSGATDTSTDSTHRDASWSTVFESLLQHREHGNAVVDKGSIAYVGEAFPLMTALASTRRPLLHHPGPIPASEAPVMASDAAHPSGIPSEDIAYLEAKQTFTAPPEAVLDAFITVFLERVFPLYPVVNPEELLRQNKARRIPWILLHAVCFASATFCPVQILHRAGFDDRKQARSRFYSKAKALFDIGYESSKVTTLQVSILLSFWGGSPNNHWNFYTWLSTGVTIAETIGCHRSLAGLNITPQDRSLLKRLWWVLVIRDAACASMHGRPFRVNLDHCDADELTMEDFEYDVPSRTQSVSPINAQLAGLYQIQAVRLALLLRQIVTIRFYPQSQTASSPPMLNELLMHWRNELPACLQWTDNDSTHADIFRTTLCVLYSHNVILAHIKPESPADDNNALSPSSWLGDEVASFSAQQIASLACSMVTTSEELVPPHEMFHGLFMACVVFFVQSRSNNLMVASLGRSGLTNCRMVLHVHRETWDASLWITQLFDKALARPARERTPVPRADVPLGHSTLSSHTNLNNLDVLDTSGLFLDGSEGWPNHLFLGDLFDPSVNAAAFGPSTSGYGQPFSTQFL